MSGESSTSGTRLLARRLAMWMLPPHRKDWGEAMLNEALYIEQRGAARQWVLGCVVTAFRERVIFELGRPIMSRRISRIFLVLGALLIVGGIGTYIDLKPYQRERIWIAVRESVHPGERTRPLRKEEAGTQAAPANP